MKYQTKRLLPNFSLALLVRALYFDVLIGQESRD